MNEQAASFRDRSGFLFYREGQLLRQVNQAYQEDYDLLMESGLYSSLVASSLLISHTEVDIPPPLRDLAYKVIKPAPVQFISYPYEWCFSQLKDAALATLAIQKIALDFGMSLKDGSAYNIQFERLKPVLIDTLSFEKYREGEPWVAYRQFCQHFLAPLVLMSYRDIRLSQLLKIYIDGVPLDLSSCLLPARTRFRFSILSHIHLHARSQKRYAGRTAEIKSRKISRLAFRGIIDSLETTIRKLQWEPRKSEWGDYYEDTNYSAQAMSAKKRIVDSFFKDIDPGVVWDLGANTGIFSRIATSNGGRTISLDSDPVAVEKNYLTALQENEVAILPLVQDLINPSPGIGWENKERMSILARGSANTVLALALIHHLAIANNLPLGRIARFFRTVGNILIVEFIPKADSQVKRLLASREDIFTEYTRQAFEMEFANYFNILRTEKIPDSERILYLMTGI